VKRFWVAHARGCDFASLRAKGFLTLYPAVDDYVFLEMLDENRKFLKKQLELGIAFLRKKETYVTVSEAEIKGMSQGGSNSFSEGEQILVVSGPGEGLDGIVKEVRPEGKLLCELQGFKRTYDLEVDQQDLIRKLDKSEKL